MTFWKQFLMVGLITTATLAPIHLAAQSVQLGQVGRPSVEFYEENGEAAGIHPSLFAQLGIESGQAVKITAPTGRAIGVPALPFGRVQQTIYLNQRMRNLLQIEDGTVAMTVERIQWPISNPGGAEARFNRVLRPPVDFLELGDAVGMSLVDMERLGAAPGMTATLQGPGGTVSVSLQLLDRGPGTILMKQTLRRSIGIDDGEGQNLRLVMQASRGAALPTTTPPASAAPTTPLEWLNLPDAAAAARQSGRPILVVVNGPRATQVRQSVEHPEARTSAGRCVLSYLDPLQSEALTQRLGITEQTAIVFITGSGEVLSRLDGITTPAMVSAAVDGVLRAQSQRN